MLASGVMAVVMILMITVFRVQNYGIPVFVAVAVGTLGLVLFACERIVLIERRAFTCTKCGYDLQGLPTARCPECGTPFDPTEK